MLWITVVSMNSETSRVESVSSASLMTSNISRVFRTNSRASSMSSGGLASTFGLGLYSHSSARVQPLLEFADRREVLIHPLLVGFRQRAVEPLRLVADEVEHAAALLQRLDVRRDFVRLALHEQLFETASSGCVRRRSGRRCE